MGNPILFPLLVDSLILGTNTDMAAVIQSRDLRYSISHLPLTMGVGDVHPTSSIRYESSANGHGIPHTPREIALHTTTTAPPPAAIPTEPGQANHYTSRSRSSTITQSSQPIPPTVPHGYAPASQPFPTHAQDTEPDESRYEGHPNNPDHGSIPPSPRLGPTQRSVLSFTESRSTSPARIKVRDLGHIQSFASEEVLTRSRRGSTHSLRAKRSLAQQYEISAMPVSDIIEMVAGLLTKITTTNDRQHEHLHRHVPPPEGSSGLSQQASSVLAFHGKNVPSISILAYLSRIHKYCPTTYEVFLSLLVYFDRMTEMINNGTLPIFAGGNDGKDSRKGLNSSDSSDSTTIMAGPATPPPLEASEPMHTDAKTGSSAELDSDAYKLSHFFVVDSFNIHRLVIAGVTCASKFFSDVFYTNSRYAKV